MRVLGTLNEYQARLFVADRAIGLGRGAITHLARLTGMSRVTITQGVRDLSGAEKLRSASSGRVRNSGGGRKKVEDGDPALLVRLREIVEETTAGDPMSPLKWTSKSTIKPKQQVAELMARLCLSRRISIDKRPCNMSIRQTLWPDPGRLAGTNPNGASSFSADQRISIKESPLSSRSTIRGHIPRNRSNRNNLRQFPTRTQISFAVGLFRIMWAKSSSFDIRIRSLADAYLHTSASEASRSPRSATCRAFALNSLSMKRASAGGS